MSSQLGISFIPEISIAKDVTAIEKLVITKELLEETLRKQGIDASISIVDNHVIVSINVRSLFKNECFDAKDSRIIIDLTCIGLMRVENEDIVIDVSKVRKK
jgi:hypothetical protein